MKNRESLYPGRVKLTPVDAANGIYDLVRADEPQEEGTPLNKKLLDFAVAACGVTAGTATAYTLDDEFGGFELVDGAKVNFRLHVASGVNPTLNVNGTGAKAIRDVRGLAMQAGIPEGTWVIADYSASKDCYTVTWTDIAPELVEKWNKSVRMLMNQTLASKVHAITVPIDINCKYINVKLFNAVPYSNDTAFAKINNTQLLSDYNMYFEELKYSESGVTHRVVSYRNPGDIINNAPIMNGSMDISLMPTDTFVGIDTSVFRAGDSESSIWRSTGRLAITSRSGLQLQIWAGDAYFMGFGAGTQILVTGVIE